jgi:hypothetical protein
MRTYFLVAAGFGTSIAIAMTIAVCVRYDIDDWGEDGFQLLMGLVVFYLVACLMVLSTRWNKGFLMYLKLGACCGIIVGALVGLLLEYHFLATAINNGWRGRQYRGSIFGGATVAFLIVGILIGTILFLVLPLVSSCNDPHED